MGETPTAAELARLDLNLLVALDVLLRERSVTRAAERLNLTQPTLSASLRRLRRHFKDELLVRVGNRNELTPLGVVLAPLVATALGVVSRVFATASPADPSTSARQFTLIASDYGASVAGPPLARALADEAPSMRVHLRQASPLEYAPFEQRLREVDGLLMPHGLLPSALPHLDLYTDRWVIVTAHDNSRVGAELTLGELRELPWVVTFSGGGSGTAAWRHLQLLGVEASAQIVVDSFLAVPLFLAGTDRVALLQERLARQMTGLRLLECPFDVVPLVQALWWHPVYDLDPEHIWLREKLATLMS
ncbi:LysR family transcriptional regulator [Actinoplanes campanulatus]|uniref:LysR family transcriptional regulator n=1 Tax=Actinoplanes campanulatus TaxID=113559 RepID=UPI001EF1BCD3|nr:LysR family transcriptional regulator [Actinoplanes capillaceus]